MAAELPVWVFGRCRWVSGVCRRTTCQDVLEAVLAAPSPGGPDAGHEPGSGSGLGAGPAGAAEGGRPDPSAHVIVERWKGVERRLDGRVRILKVWSAWGEAQSEVQLQVRRVAEKASSRHGSTAGSRRHRKRAAGGKRAVGLGTGHGSGGGGHHHRPGPTVRHHDQEEVHRLMRLILAQGETIAGQLRRLREREAQIERLEVEAHREREAQHGKDYVLAAYLGQDADEDGWGVEDADLAANKHQDTPRTSRQPAQPGRPGGIRPRQLVGEQDDAVDCADESDAEPHPGGGGAGDGLAARGRLGGTAPVASSSAAPGPSEPPHRPQERRDDAVLEGGDDLRTRIALWEKVVKVNKRLEQQEERLVRLYVGFRRSDPDGMAVDDRDQLRTSLARLEQDIQDGQRSLQANADLLTETEALLDAKRRLLRRLLAEMEAADLDTARLMAVMDATRSPADAAPAPPSGPPPHLAAPARTLVAASCSGQLSQLSQLQSQVHSKGLDNDSNSDTGLSSLHSSSEEGVYILDTLV